MLGQFTTIPNALFLDERLPRSCVIVFGILQNHAGTNGQIYPSYDTIANEGKISRRTAIYAVKTLTQYGYIAKQTRFSDDKGCMTSNFYYLNPNPQVFSLKNVDKLASYPQHSANDCTTPSAKVAPQVDSSEYKNTRAKDSIIYLPIRTHENPKQTSGEGGNRPSLCENNVEILGQGGTKKQKSAFDASVAPEFVENYMQK